MRGFIVVLDSFGVGAAPDAKAFGDEGASTIKTISKSVYFNTPNMKKMGLLAIDGVGLDSLEKHNASYGRLRELSIGKDTTTGHWEMAGIVSKKALPTFPNGFPSEVIDEFEKQCGRKVIVNKPYSGTQVIKDYGDEHIKTGALIVYTSADSVFQIAACEDIVSDEELYNYCKIARKILVGKYAVGRVIARPFIKDENGNFIRTARRHDFSLEPPGDIRELKNCIQRAVLLSADGWISLEGLNLDLTVGREETASLSEEEKEKRLLLKTLEEAEGNRARTARMLGISRTSLYEKLKKYRII